MNKNGQLLTNDIAVRQLRQFMISGERSAGEVPALVKEICANEGWRKRIDEQTREEHVCETFEEFVTAKVPKGLGSSVEVLRKLCGDDKGAREAIKRALLRQKTRDNPEPVKRIGRPTKNVSTSEEQKHFSESSNGGTSADYRIRKLRRDHPEVAERLAAGQFKSVAAAERASRGEEPNPPRKQKTPLEQIQLLYGKLSKKDRKVLLAWLEANNE